MSQFSVHRNRDGASAKTYPYLIDVQAHAVTSLPTRVVVPLAPAKTLPYSRITRLMPLVEILDESFVLVTQELAGIQRHQLGEPVAQLDAYRSELVAALDLLFTGV